MDLTVLNRKQLEAVTAPMGPVLVLAGAGSGKTRVLTYRIAYLIEQGLVQPEQILAVTFTNKAAKEMQGRVMQLLAGADLTRRAGQPLLGTFHSIGARILRKDISRLGYLPGFVILDSDDQLRVIKDIVAELDLPKTYAPTMFRAYISSAKNLLQTPANLNVGLDGYMHELVQKVYTQYQNFLYRQNSVDFDDLLMLPIKLFESFPEVLRKYQALWEYILVDEYQDTNQAQYMFLHFLAKSRNLFVVGDDAQSIYGFRGSNIGNILNFEKDFADALVVKLEQNYRSTQNILAAAQKVIELNSEQKPKTLWTENPPGDKVIVEEVYDGRAEAVYVARQIIRLATGQTEEPDYVAEEPAPFSILDHLLAKQRRGPASGIGVPQLPAQHGPLSGFAVLYRTHAQSRQVEEAMMEAGIPYQIVGGVKFYERKEIKDVMAYLRLLANPADILSLKRVVNLPPRGIGEKSFGIIKTFILGFADSADSESTGDPLSRLQDWMERLAGIGLSVKQRQSLREFYELLLRLAQLNEAGTLSDLLKLIVATTRMEEYLFDGTEMGEARIENVRELYSVGGKWDHLPWREGLQQFLEEVALITDIDNVTDKEAVTLMTLHAAKGLEFDTVFFIGLEEGVLPHTRALLDPGELAEEVRLAYVGLTRARHRLFLLYAQNRQMYGGFQSNPPSRILQALPPQSIRLRGNPAQLYRDDDRISYEPF